MHRPRILSRSMAATMLAGLLVLGSSSAAGAVAPPIFEYPLPAGGSGAYGITTGPDGNLWVTDFFHNTIVKVAPSGSMLASYAIPTADSNPHGITAGPDGNLWFVEEAGQKIARITTTGLITEYPLTTPSSRPQAITVGPDCNLWFTDAFGLPASSRIGYITPSGVITEFPSLGTGRYPWGIHSGPDGNLWFAEFNGNNIGRITPTGTVTEFPIDVTVNTGGGAPIGITWGPDDKIWFTMTNGNVIGRMATDGSGITYFPQPNSSSPHGITDGPDGNLWFVNSQTSMVGQIGTTGVIVTNATPTPRSGPEEITTGPDGAVWFTEYATNKIGRVPMPGTTAPGRPGNVTAIAMNGGAKVSWTAPTFDGGSPITRYSITPYIGNVAQTVTTVNAPAASAVITGLATDTSYSFRVSAANAVIGSGPKARTCGTVTPEPPVSVLPAPSNGAYGGYKTVVYVENTGSAPTHVSINYFDASGNAVGTGDVNNNLAPHALWVVPQDNNHSFSVGQAGSGVISSGQPISAFVNEFAPGGSDATSYSARSLATGVGSTLYVPTIVNGAYGGYTTGIGLLNLATAAADLTITYRDAGGSVIKTQARAGVPAGAYVSVYSGDATLALPSGFAGTATIASSAGNLAAVVNEVGPGGQFSSFAAVPAGNLTAFAPTALNAAYGGYHTGMAIQNTTSASGTLTVTYYDGTGTPSSRILPISANGYVGLYQGDPVNGTPAPGAYTATISSDVRVAVIVNEFAPVSGPARQSTSYNAIAAGLATANLPLVESAGADGWSTGEGIMNTGSTVTTVTITYYDTATGVQIGTPAQKTLQPNAFWGAYQPSAGLPSGLRATAAVTTSAGGQVAVICNESNASSFMSYAGQ